MLLHAPDGAVVDFLIVYTHHVSQLITVKSPDVNVQVQVVYQLGFVLLYGVYHSVDIIWEHVLIVPVQVVYPHGLVVLYGVYPKADTTPAKLLI